MTNFLPPGRFRRRKLLVGGGKSSYNAEPAFSPQRAEVRAYP
jgi:hypothetical protein